MADFRRPWATFRSIYLVFKLLNVLIVVVVQKNNCLFRQHSTTYLSVIRQGCLLAFLSLYSLFAMKTLPYLDIPSNSSDVCSRIGYSLLAMLGLLAALGLPRTDPATLFVNIVLYSLSIYFVVISTSWAQRLVKKAHRRIDFSIDIFSPALNLDKHFNRRVWQETLATIFLCSPEFAMPPGHSLVFNDEVSPYLLGFTGSQAERLAEDLKILRTIGLPAYQDAVARLKDSRLSELRDTILPNLLGPDRYYDPVGSIARTSSLFGRIDVVPFPFVVIFRYDDSPAQPLHLITVDELELLVSQNSSAQVQAARRVRLALRALDGQIVFAPHSETVAVSSYFRSRVERHVTYRQAVLHVGRNSTFEWNGYNCSSGFAVRLDYTDGESVDSSERVRKGLKGTRSGASIGVFPNFQLSKPLAILFRQNRQTIEARQPQVEAALQAHSDHFAREAASKEHTLSYSMLLSAFLGRDLDSLAKHESSLAVRHLGSTHALSLRGLEERWRSLEGGTARAWWYLLWDDLWRRNRAAVNLPEHRFSPHYSTSLCYQPMGRKGLEGFLQLSGIGIGKRSFFHPGLLNRIYFHLDMLLLTDTSRIIPVHLPGETTTRISRLAARIADVHQKEVQHAPASRFTVSTGAGTDENDGEIRQRTAYLWEEAVVEPRPASRDFTNYLRWLFATRLPQKTAVFLGLSPIMTDWRPRQGDELLIELADLDGEEMQCKQ
ncbi:hypothetical protein JCM10908_001061 [Rhodotorula pacifica]|uniref:uncharacterized protein n=1 Tax=Rhodotorula pacifica TaxID=1495444 RepID=UPI00317B4DCB